MNPVYCRRCKCIHCPDDHAACDWFLAIEQARREKAAAEANYAGPIFVIIIMLLWLLG